MHVNVSDLTLLYQLFSAAADIVAAVNAGTLLLHCYLRTLMHISLRVRVMSHHCQAVYGYCS